MTEETEKETINSTFTLTADEKEYLIFLGDGDKTVGLSRAIKSSGFSIWQKLMSISEDKVTTVYVDTGPSPWVFFSFKNSEGTSKIILNNDDHKTKQSLYKTAAQILSKDFGLQEIDILDKKSGKKLWPLSVKERY
jgi:hypothetical protein